MQHSSFLSRTIAFIIDIALLSCLHQILFFLLGSRIAQLLAIDPMTFFMVAIPLYILIYLPCFILLSMFYFAIFHAWFGQTLGKMIIGIKVVSENNMAPSLCMAFLRWTGYFLSLLPLAVGFLWSAVDKDHAAWHDKLALTRVVAVEMT